MPWDATRTVGDGSLVLESWSTRALQCVAIPVQPARLVVLYKLTWQASWERGDRWRWVSLDLLMLSLNLGYRPMYPSQMKAGLGPVDSVPLVWTPWRVSGGGAEIGPIFNLSWYSPLIQISMLAYISQQALLYRTRDLGNDTDKVDSFFYRWFVVQSTRNSHYTKLSPFLIDKAIKTIGIQHTVHEYSQ